MSVENAYWYANDRCRPAFLTMVLQPGVTLPVTWDTLPLHMHSPTACWYGRKYSYFSLVTLLSIIRTLEFLAAFLFYCFYNTSTPTRVAVASALGGCMVLVGWYSTLLWMGESNGRYCIQSILRWMQSMRIILWIKMRLRLVDRSDEAFGVDIHTEELWGEQQQQESFDRHTFHHAYGIDPTDAASWHGRGDMI